MAAHKYPVVFPQSLLNSNHLDSAELSGHDMIRAEVEPAEKSGGEDPAKERIALKYVLGT